MTRGDFSKRPTFNSRRNTILLQQGQVLRDTDWNDHAFGMRQWMRDLTMTLVGSSGIAADADAWKPRDGFKFGPGVFFLQGYPCRLDQERTFEPVGPKAEERGKYLAYLEACERAQPLSRDEDPPSSISLHVAFEVRHLALREKESFKDAWSRDVDEVAKLRNAVRAQVQGDLPALGGLSRFEMHRAADGGLSAKWCPLNARHQAVGNVRDGKIEVAERHADWLHGAWSRGWSVLEVIEEGEETGHVFAAPREPSRMWRRAADPIRVESLARPDGEVRLRLWRAHTRFEQHVAHFGHFALHLVDAAGQPATQASLEVLNTGDFWHSDDWGAESKRLHGIAWWQSALAVFSREGVVENDLRRIHTR